MEIQSRQYTNDDMVNIVCVCVCVCVKTSFCIRNNHLDQKHKVMVSILTLGWPQPRMPGLFGFGYPLGQVKTWGGGTLARDGYPLVRHGVPLRDRTAGGVLDTWPAVCPLRSRRRTFLLSALTHFPSKYIISQVGLEMYKHLEMLDLC